MWTIPIPDGTFVPNAPFLVAIPGLGPVLVLMAFAVVTGLVWLIGREVCLSEQSLACPIDGTACDIVTDRRGRLVACNPAPARRGIDDCHGLCLTT